MLSKTSSGSEASTSGAQNRRKICACVHVFPSLDTVELVTVNPVEGVVEVAASASVRFDPVSRQLEDPDAFVSTLKQLFQENRVPLNQPAVLVLPSLFTRTLELPTAFNHEEMALTLVSEAERFYLFKKNEPQLDWYKINEMSVIYSAYPKSEIEKFVDVFQSAGIPLVGIEMNYFSLLRGLGASGLIQSELETGSRWCYLMVTDSTFYAAIVEGSRVDKLSESPISVTADDIMSTVTEIQQDFERFTGLDVLSKLVVINNSSRLSSDVLINRLGFSDQTTLIEQAANTLRSRNPNTGIYSCSLEALGGTFFKEMTEFTCVNLLPVESEEKLAVQQMQSLVMKGLIGVNVACLLLGVAIWGFLNLLAVSKEASLQRLNEGMQQFAVGNNAEITRRMFVKNALARNVQFNDLLVTLATQLPATMWYDKLIVSVDDPTEGNQNWLHLEGNALSPEPVNQFRTQVQEQSFIKDLDVSNMELKTSPTGQTYYAWLIQSKKAEVAPTNPAAGGANAGSSPAAPPAEAGPPGGPPH
ncbi:MAG: hypothetical protein SFZ03_07390 [Candidatus Melainabacteria bacterium]|nr:hypothetical protein [Candidatus Melainabacteria bacterium]